MELLSQPSRQILQVPRGVRAEVGGNANALSKR